MSTNRTIATLFGGFEGVGVGARAAGYDHLWGVEWSAKLAAVAERNGFNSIVADVCKVQYLDLPKPYHLHGSPSCKKASIANSQRGETEEDREAARAVVRAVEGTGPEVFPLENIRLYEAFDSFKLIIVPALKRLGYGVAWDVLNAADYGVPQTRERLILRAVRGQDRPLLPVATHARADKLTPMFDDRLPWVGWYEAIADLIPTLPASAFAPWQLKRLPAEIANSLLVYGENTRANADGVLQNSPADEPVLTVRADLIAHGAMPRAFIVGGSNTSDVKAAPGVGVSMADEPVRAVPSDIGPTRYRAFVLDGESSDTPGNKGVSRRDGDDPIFTIGASQHKQPARVYLVDGQASGTSDRVTPRAEDDPAYTVSTSDGGGRQGRAIFAAGRVVSMTPRALARFQSFPDSYWLPDHKGTACEGIGNAVPPLFFQRVIELNDAGRA